MSDKDKKDEKKDDKAAPAALAKPSKGAAIAGILLPAVFAGGAAFGGARVAGAMVHTRTVVVEAPAAPKPPGPTLPLEPFLVTLAETNGKPHAMKVVLAVEFSNSTKEEVLKPLGLRVRDASLTYLRTLNYDLAADRSKVDQIRNELLEAIKKAGATTAERVLITDFVLQ